MFEHPKSVTSRPALPCPRCMCKCRPSSIPGWTVSRIGATVSGKRQTTDTCCGGDQSEGTLDEGAWHSTLYSIADMEPPRSRCSCSCSSTADCAKHLALAEVCTIALGACSVCEGTLILTYLSAANCLSKRRALAALSHLAWRTRYPGLRLQNLPVVLSRTLVYPISIC